MMETAGEPETSRKPIEITSPILLVVEGRDEELFFREVARSMGMKGVQILPIGGKTLLEGSVEALVMAPGFAYVSSLGIVRDADTDPLAAFESVTGALRRAGLAVPDNVMKRTGDGPGVAVMILPSMESPGALEDVCLRAVSQERVMPCVRQYAKCLSDLGVQIPAHRRSKMDVQVFLASKAGENRPCLRVGEAAQAGCWPWHSDAFEPIRRFLKIVAEA